MLSQYKFFPEKKQPPLVARGGCRLKTGDSAIVPCKFRFLLPFSYCTRPRAKSTSMKRFLPRESTGAGFLLSGHTGKTDSSKLEFPM